jgi:lipopolysaccharide transport system ATP-binding protein
MSQVLELCEEAIWIDKGEIRMHGESFLVVKAYEEHLHGPVSRVSVSIRSGDDERQCDTEGMADEAEPNRQKAELLLQEPAFQPHAESVAISSNSRGDKMKWVARGGISRWQSEPGIKVCGFSIHTQKGETNELVCLSPAKIVIHLSAELDQNFVLRYGIVISDHLGRNVTVIYSPLDRFSIQNGQSRKVVVGLNPVQLGPGEYTLGISILEGTKIEYINQARRFDLLGRSFEFSVRLPDTLGVLNCALLHSAEWEFSS